MDRRENYKIITTANTGFPSGGVTCKLGVLSFYSSSVLADSFVLRTPPRTQSPKTLGTIVKNKDMKKTVFISSTFEDLKEHRKKVWEILDKYYEVNIRGMERFGARKEAPLQTCLAEVEQSDIFVGVISCRLGTVDPTSSKSFVQLEYEKALELDKEIFIYLIDDKNGKVSPFFVDRGKNHDKLESFKSILKERHTIDTFIDEDDLADKLKRKFDELLSKKANQLSNAEDDFEKSNDIIHKFLLLPKVFSSKELKLRIKLDGEPFPASKAICRSFCLSYGKTIGIRIKIIKPKIEEDAFNYLFVESKQAERFLNLNKEKEIEIYASPNFSEDTIDNIRAHFVSRTVSYVPTSMLLDLANNFAPQIKTETIQAEGQIILLLKDIVDEI